MDNFQDYCTSLNLKSRIYTEIVKQPWWNEFKKSEYYVNIRYNNEIEVYYHHGIRLVRISLEEHRFIGEIRTKFLPQELYDLCNQLGEDSSLPVEDMIPQLSYIKKKIDSDSFRRFISCGKDGYGYPETCIDTRLDFAGISSVILDGTTMLIKAEKNAVPEIFTQDGAHTLVKYYNSVLKIFKLIGIKKTFAANEHGDLVIQQVKVTKKNKPTYIINL